jgi:hypothetical protein
MHGGQNSSQKDDSHGVVLLFSKVAILQPVVQLLWDQPLAGLIFPHHRKRSIWRNALLGAYESHFSAPSVPHGTCQIALHIGLDLARLRVPWFIHPYPQSVPLAACRTFCNWRGFEEQQQGIQEVLSNERASL